MTYLSVLPILNLNLKAAMLNGDVLSLWALINGSIHWRAFCRVVWCMVHGGLNSVGGAWVRKLTHCDVDAIVI